MIGNHKMEDSVMVSISVGGFVGLVLSADTDRSRIKDMRTESKVDPDIFGVSLLQLVKAPT